LKWLYFRRANKKRERFSRKPSAQKSDAPTKMDEADIHEGQWGTLLAQARAKNSLVVEKQ
jgi:hypothetical protein